MSRIDAEATFAVTVTPTPEITSAAGLTPPAPKRSRAAIASLVCGIAGPCTLGICSIVGLALGIKSLSKIKKSGGQLTGRGTAIAGIVLSAIGVVALLFLLLAGGTVLLWRALESRSPAPTARGLAGSDALANAGLLATSIRTYGERNGRQFPPMDSWPEALSKQATWAPSAMADPGDPASGRMFAMNAALRGMTLDAVSNPRETVLLFECAPGSPTAGGRELLPGEPRGPWGYVIAFVDGHAETVSPRQLDRLIWDPQRGSPATVEVTP